MNISRTTLRAAALLGALMVAGCAASAPSQGPAATATPAPAVTPAPAATPAATPAAQKFTAATSGKLLAARIMARAQPKSAGVKITGVQCKNFPDLKVGTHTDCQVMANGVKRGYLVTFTERDGHYVLKAQKLTW
ncbi:hypothetical protein [Arthrobacter sp. AFG20]|uniref:hypothetical protein n=1 Tax=Arthrobacter sp. AFG20 TaxID=1688671 RepID=UPI000C9E98ED|nr:hypothetical protein [Arthrobacter sp. AFG20]PNH79539.1 hypothetical protein CXZ05_20235 [Arthrobacter sp. AFG20]